MEKIRKYLLYFIIGVIIVSVLIVACTNKLDDKDNKDQKWDYRPMISKEGYVYGETGKLINTFPEEFILLGKIES